MARRLTRLYEAELRRAGVSAMQFELLGTLQQISGAAHGPSQTELAAQLDLDQTTLSRNLKAMIAAGWVEARPDPLDQRRVRYALSPAGAQRVFAAMPHWETASQRVSAGLGKQSEAVFAAMERLAASA